MVSGVHESPFARRWATSGGGSAPTIAMDEHEQSADHRPTAIAPREHDYLLLDPDARAS